MADEQRPLLRVVRGIPSDDELAALTAVMAGMSGRTAEPTKPKPKSRWADRAALVRQPLPFGPGAWRASGLPH